MTNLSFTILAIQLAVFALTSLYCYVILPWQMDNVLLQKGLPLPPDSFGYWSLTDRGGRGMQYAAYIILKKPFSGSRYRKMLGDFNFREQASLMQFFISLLFYANIITCLLWFVPYILLR